MPMIETQRDDIRNLKGLHLYHFAASNCSQRARMALEEKQLRWVSHHINLSKNEHTTEAFQALNPKGVVPVLVHDGKTITESNDIITYIDEEFEGPRLQPTTARDKDLVDFMREFSSEKGFSDRRLRDSIDRLIGACTFLEERLDSNRWLNGETFGLADISWIVNIYRLNKMAFPLNQYPGLSDWLARVSRRSSFKKAIAKYESPAMTCFFSLYTFSRKLRGTSISNYL